MGTRTNIRVASNTTCYIIPSSRKSRIFLPHYGFYMEAGAYLLAIKFDTYLPGMLTFYLARVEYKQNRFNLELTTRLLTLFVLYSENGSIKAQDLITV